MTQRMIMCGCEEKCFHAKKFASQECMYLKHGVEYTCKITGTEVKVYIDKNEREKLTIGGLII